MARRRPVLPLDLLTLALFLCPSASLPFQHAQFAVQATSANGLDFSPLGSVAIAGDFAGLQIWDESYATSLALAGNGTAASLWTRNSNGTLSALGATNTGGSISALCQSSKSNLVYLGGNFTTIGGQTAANVASYNPSSNSFAALGGGVDGPVLSLACDDSSQTVYVGGAFQAPVGGGSGYAGHVASWSTSSSSWSALPFGGLNGDVLAIEPVTSSSGQSVLFGGAFSLSLANASDLAADSNYTAAIPSLASGLTPISLSGASVWAGPASSEAGYGNASAIFCPPGADGQPGSTFLGADGQSTEIVVNLGRPVRVGGLRLGNTFFQGRGTNQFKIITIPDGVVETFTYASNPSDPTSNLATCSWDCSLSNNASILYQDFLFPNETEISGFQIDLDGYYGAGPGLHLVQLLSQGAYAYAVTGFNGDNATCTNGIGAVLGSSTVSTDGDWDQISVGSALTGVDEQVLKQYIAVGSSSTSSVTFSPYIGWEGEYNVSLTLPGCNEVGDCAQRTSVDITTSPGAGAASVTATVNELTTEDAAPVFYTGPLSQGATFTVRLSSNPTGGGSNGYYHVIVDSIQLVAFETDGIIAGAQQPARGLFEYVVSGARGAFGDGSASTVNAATTAISNATHFDALAAGLPSGSSVAAIASASDLSATFVGGNFTYAAAGMKSVSILAYPASVVIPQGGLAGAVNALVVYDGFVYAGGAFNATADGSVQGLGGIARWQYGQAGQGWQALGGGLVPSFGSGVQALEILSIGGSNQIVAAGGSAIASYDPSSSSWVPPNSAFFSGTVEALAGSYMAGTVRSMLQYATSDAAQLITDDGSPSLEPYSFTFSAGTSSTTASGVSMSAHARRHEHRSAIGRALGKRAAAPSATSLPTAFSASSVDGNVLTGVWWQNGSAETAILGGRFTSGSVQNVGYVSNGSIFSLPGLGATNGAIQALATASNILLVGGSFTSVNGTQGLVVYDLNALAPISNQPSVQPYDGGNVSINAIATRPNNGTATIVAGYFAAVGSLPCQSICQYDSTSNTWSSLGTGLSGVVGSIDFAGTDASLLIAAGDFQVNGATAFAAQWDFDAQTWTALTGGINVPGPATAVSADDANSQNIFLAGTASADGSAAPYVLRWNGTVWSDVSNGALSSGFVQHLAFVPLSASSAHDNSSIVESDRVLLAFGSIALGSFGSIASALYDGSSWSPFLVSATSAGAAGAIASFFYSSSSFQSAKHYMAAGLVILISIAIALGVMFLLVLLGLLIALKTRRNPNETPHYPVSVPISEADQKATTPGRRPTSLLATLGAATVMMASEKGGKLSRESTPEHDTSDSIDDGDIPKSATAFVSAKGDAPAEDDAGEELTVSRFSFVGENAGELTVAAEQELRILDRSDDHWWLVQDTSGNRGLIPASYVL